MKKNTCKRSAALLLALLLCLVGIFSLPVAAEGEQRLQLQPGGMPFGVRFFTEGILVVGFCDVKSGGRDQNPAKEAGLRPGDSILKIQEQPLKTATELVEALRKNGMGPVTLTCRRGEETFTVTLTPLPCDEDGRLRTGLFVRDSGAGIGTVTFIVPEKNTFAGLGHGICDGESGTLIPISHGNVLGVTIGGVVRGEAGAPGEVRGHFSAGKTGGLLSNTVCGVSGVFTECPVGAGAPMPVGHRGELHNGKAKLLCTLDDNTLCEYEIEISAINREATGNKCFTVKVTDPALLARTGGIIQGMSGSPIIQDGMLMGAVTHVLIGDPTTGYGIFIENMLNDMPELLK